MVAENVILIPRIAPASEGPTERYWEKFYILSFFWIQKHNVRAIRPAARSSRVEPKLSKIKNEYYRHKQETYNGMPNLDAMVEICPLS